jgi:transposase InsO family protein
VRAVTSSIAKPAASRRFVLAIERAGIRHRYIQPRRPEQNGKVERSHRVDTEEFWGRHAFERFEAAAAALGQWERVYNERPPDAECSFEL